MPSKDLPSRLDLRQYRTQAKDLVKAHARGEPDALRRIAQHHPRPDAARFQLADAQLVIAREHGCASWPVFAAQIEALRPEVTGVATWRAADAAAIAGDDEALARLL